LVAAAEPPKSENRFPGKAARGHLFLVNTRYADPKTSPLTVEVVREPAAGRYDLRLTK
jgi:hypothetical protein